MEKSLKILAIDDGATTLERRVYQPMQAALANKGITLEYQIVGDYEQAIDALKKGFRPDAITQDYLIPYDCGTLRGGESGPYHLEKILEYIDGNIPGYAPKPFMLTYSTSDSAVAVQQLKTLKKHDTQVITPSDMSGVINNLESAEIHPLKQPSAFSHFMRQRFGDDIVVHPEAPKPPELTGLEKVFAESADIQKDLPRLDLSDAVLHKSLSPDVYDEDEAKTHRLQCLKSNTMPVQGYAAFTAQDVEKLVSEKKKPVLFIQDYSAKEHGPLLSKVAGIVCLGSGGSHLLVRGIPAVGKVKQEIWNEKTGEGIDLCHIEQVRDGLAVINNSHAVIRAISTHPKDSATAPQPEYEKKNKVLLFMAGDEVTLARTAAYQGHLDIKQPNFDSDAMYEMMKKVYALKKSLPFKHPTFLANLPAAGDYESAFWVTHKAEQAGADGIGLVRTEYMLDAEQLKSVKEGILTNNPAHYACLAKEDDSVHAVMNVSFRSEGYTNPVRIRLFDFAPDEVFSAEELQKLKKRVGDVPSGTPLALVTEGLYEEQLKSIFTKAKHDYPVQLQIMAPHIRNAGEMQKVRMMAEKAAEAVGFARDQFQIGTMMETAQACKPAEAAKIAKLCDFASFGTNDLTAEITGTPRNYTGEGINPYQTLDDKVKNAMQQATTAMRKANPRIKLSCCGGQMRDLDSLAFCAQKLQLDEVSVPDDAFHLVGRQLQLLQLLAREHEKAAGTKAAAVISRREDPSSKQR